MLAMAKRKKIDRDGANDRHANRMLGVRPSAEMREVIETLAAKERRKPTSMALLLIEDALIARGLWPASVDGEVKEKGGGK